MRSTSTFAGKVIGLICPLVFSLVSQRLEYGDEWSPEPGELPDGADLALDPGRHRGQ